jgi:hypothetical protein
MILLVVVKEMELHEILSSHEFIVTCLSPIGEDDPSYKHSREQMEGKVISIFLVLSCESNPGSNIAEACEMVLVYC